eukprot:236975-Ditylum_brightwellii.AAC.1
MNWPPKKLKGVSQTNVDFYDFYWTVDDLGTPVACWMDNIMVFMVSTVHRMGEAVTRMSRRPRIMVKNKRNVAKIWGKQKKLDPNLFLGVEHHY